MSDKTSIEWTNATWNPVTGCTRVSPGCDHCYALTFAERFRGVPNHPYQQGFDLKLWPDRLELPLGWKKPRRIFVNSMSDLFHKDVPDSFVREVFTTMIRADHHVYQVLTKRPSRLVKTRLIEKITTHIHHLTGSSSWPTHIWLGVSVETTSYAWRVDALRKIPASVRFISAEPLLVLSMAYALMVLIGLSVGERVGLAVVPVIQSGCEVCVISVRIQESPFSTSNGEGVHPNQVDAYLMAELGTNSLKNLW